MAGPRTHIEMGAEMWKRFSMIEPHIDMDSYKNFTNPQELFAFFSGCIFPDWGYDGINRDAAEDSHWPPYHDAFFAFLRQNYPQPWNAMGRRLSAFYLGVIVHSVCDELWHFSNNGHISFLDMARKEDNAGHRPCEVACEVFCHVQCRKRHIQGNFWWPSDAILEVYQSRNIPVTKVELTAGFTKLEYQLKKGARWGWLAYLYYRNKFPWTHSHYRDEQYGAIGHSAEMSAKRIKAAIEQMTVANLGG